MGREVRRIPPNWSHPTDENGHYIPLVKYITNDEMEEQIAITESRLDGSQSFDDYFVMPDWSKEECTHFQMYETTTEGTPISPVCDSPESLAQWLADNMGDAGAGGTATYEQWLYMINNGGSAPTFVLKKGSGELISGVEGIYEKQVE